MKYSIDRFEGISAILERETDSVMKKINRCLLPLEVKEGDILSDENGTYTILIAETNQRKDQISKLIDDLFED